jgi:hypothetical protein
MSQHPKFSCSNPAFYGITPHFSWLNPYFSPFFHGYSDHPLDFPRMAKHYVCRDVELPASARSDAERLCGGGRGITPAWVEQCSAESQDFESFVKQLKAFLRFFLGRWRDEIYGMGN